MRGQYKSSESSQILVGADGMPISQEILVRVVSSNPWKDMLLGAAVGFVFTKVVERMINKTSAR